MAQKHEVTVQESETAVRGQGWLALVRVRHWAHFLLLPLAGLDLPPSGLVLARGVAIALAVLAFGYLLNGISDREMDGDPGKNPLVSSLPSTSQLLLPVVGLPIIALALALSAPLPVLVATLVSLASGVVYSVGPRLKRWPVIGTLLNTTNFAPLLWVGLAHDRLSPGMVPLTIAFSVLLLQNQLLHEAADRPDDERGKVVTTVRALGARGAAACALLLGAALVATAALLPSIVLALVLAVPFCVVIPFVLARRGQDPDAMARARHAHRYLALAAGAAFFVLLRL